MSSYKSNYIVRKIIANYEKKRSDWRNSLEGRRSLRIQQDDFDRAEKEAGAPKGMGRELIVDEMLELERLGLIPKKEVRWENYKQDLSEFHYYNRDIPVYYKMAGQKPKYETVAEYKQMLEELDQKIHRQWIHDYIRDLWTTADEGKMNSRELERIFGKGQTEKYFACLEGLDALEDSMYVQLFSSRYLGRPKTFSDPDSDFRKWVIQTARRFCPEVDEAMDDSQVLSQLYIEEYSQQMEIKGSLLLEIEGETADLGKLRFGTVLNSETLKKAGICPEQKIQRVVTIENRANFIWTSYEEGTLYIYTHGFLSPKEREFLKTLALVLRGTPVEYLHSGDMDYGGLRIFCFIRDHVFPDLKPLYMDVETYRKYLPSGYEMEEGALLGLEKMNQVLPEELEELRLEMLKNRKGVEQEMLLI